jgi:hypothetical protein
MMHWLPSFSSFEVFVLRMIKPADGAGFFSGFKGYHMIMGFCNSETAPHAGNTTACSRRSLRHQR